MQKIEMNDNVEKWSSENIAIPYTLMEKINGKFQPKRHTYFVDFTVFLKNGKKYVIEIKPFGLIPLNESDIHRDPVKYKNACKWKAAINWCKLNNYEFLVVNENHLKGKIF
jgi:hypothetical protein